VATRWYDLGLQLLDKTNVLDRIKYNNHSDVECCCNEMFKEWLQTKPDANWDQLHAALIEIDLKTAASCVTTRFAKQKTGNYFVVYEWLMHIAM